MASLPCVKCIPAVNSGVLPHQERLRYAFAGSIMRRCATAASTTLALITLPVFIILTNRVVQRCLCAVAVLNISFQIQKHLFLREEAASLGALGGLQISLTNIALAGLLTAWLVGATIRSKSSAVLRGSLGIVTIPAALLLMFYTASLFVAADFTLGVFQVFSVLVLFFLYLYIAKTVTSRADVLFIVRILLIGLVIQSCLMLAQAGGLLGEIQFYFIRTMPGTFMDGRVIGTLGSPNAAAAYLAMMMVFSLGVMLGSVGRADKCLAGTGFSAAALSLILTESRGGWISLLVGLATILLIGWKRAPRKPFAVLLIVLLLLAIPFRGVISERLYGNDNGAAASRVPMNKVALLMIQDHPILGVGANNYSLVMIPYSVRGDLIGAFPYAVHNTYLLTWSEVGIGGLITLVWFLCAIASQGFKCWQLRDTMFAPLALGCSAAIVGFMVHLNFDIFRTGAAVDLMWLFGGLVTAMGRLSQTAELR